MLDSLDAAGGFSPVVGGPITDATTPVPSIAAMHPFDTYHWEKISGPTCIDGVLRETWCYIECAGGTCQPLWCEERTSGPC